MKLSPKKKLVYGITFFFLSIWFVADGVLHRGPLTGQVFVGPGLKTGRDDAAAALGSDTGIRTGDADIIETIAKIIKFILPYAGIGVFVAFFVSGLLFLFGFGSDSSIQRAQKIMIWSGVGLLLIIFSYPIVQFVIEFGA